MNLLTEKWIPVECQQQWQRISLQSLLCEDEPYQIKTFRDDMELAALQLLVCLVQVIFMPEDKKALLKNWQQAMNAQTYQQAIAPYLDWFDLNHAKTPFMQCADVSPEKGDKNWASLQKLFMGLPEKTSSSPSSNAFFETTEELQAIHPGDAAIALFQQATNGFSLGGVGYSVGLKGSMPLTTLVVHESLRKSLWCNILSHDFLQQKTGLLTAPINEPTWVIAPHTQQADERARHIGLSRGLFWQPAKVKLVFAQHGVTGFYKQTGTCTVKDYWLHPHSPIDLLRLQANNPKEKPYLSARGDQPLWGQMLSYFYSERKIAAIKQGGVSCALVVQQYDDVWREEGIQLAVGGYIKGASAESLAGRRHEIYSLANGWQEKSAELNELIDFAILCQWRLDSAVADFVGRAEVAFKDRSANLPKKVGKDGHFKKNLRAKAKQHYYTNSEAKMHGVLKVFQWDDDFQPYQQQFTELAKEVFEQVVSPYRHEEKLLEPALLSRRFLNNMLNKLLNEGETYEPNGA